MFLKFLSLLSVFCVLLCGCAAGTQHAVSCKKQVLNRVYFGLTPRGTVDESSWDRFLAEKVTPRFPGGLTVTDGRGQWLGKYGKLEHEKSKVLELVHDDDPKLNAAVAEIVESYKSEFDQEAVLVLSQQVDACL